MNQPLDTLVYHLKDGATVVYIGITNDPDGREREHEQEGKKFSHLLPATRRMTRDGAKQQEAEMLRAYRQSHGGKNPKYNEDSDG